MTNTEMRKGCHLIVNSLSRVEFTSLRRAALTVC
jgi:hypothetical protein